VTPGASFHASPVAPCALTAEWSSSLVASYLAGSSVTMTILRTPSAYICCVICGGVICPSVGCPPVIATASLNRIL